MEGALPFSLFESPSLMPFRLQQTSLGPLSPGGGVGSEIHSHRGHLSLVGEAGLVPSDAGSPRHVFSCVLAPPWLKGSQAPSPCHEGHMS